MKLRHVLSGYRRNSGLSLRAMAVEIGVQFTALQRFETGKEISAENFARILRWLLSETEVEKE
jgi:hypothetical protein